MVEQTVAVVRSGWRGYWQVASMWIRASMVYRASFWMLSIAAFVTGGLDFVGIWIMFQTIDSLGGWSLHEIAMLYGATGFSLAMADMFVGRVERLGQLVRTGALDQMMVRPIPLLAQVCADEFALRRLSRVLVCVLVLGWAATYVAWSPSRVLVAVGMLLGGSLIFSAIFVMLACVQFWTEDSSEVANAFTYGGSTITQYPLTIFPSEIVRTLTYLVPVAFVNWYPTLHLLDRPDPFDQPTWFQFLSVPVGVLLVAVTGLVWRAGVRHYRSTGS